MPGGAYPTPGTLRAEDTIELRHATHLCNWIRLIDNDHHIVLPADHIVRACQNRDAGRCVALSR